MRGDTGSIDFEHFFFKNEVFSPQLFDVGFDGATNWSKIVETCTATVDLKALKDDKPSFE